MLWNFVNRYDLLELTAFLRREGAARLVSALAALPGKRVLRAWQHTEAPPCHWWDLPQVNRRWNLLVTGDENVPYDEHIHARHLARRAPLIGLSLGCGAGHRERRWASLGGFEAIDAHDISEARIRQAIAGAADAGYQGIIRYHVDDIRTLDLPHGHYQVAFLEQSLHHLSPVEEVLERVARCLRPDGILVVNEFVGPTRFQWTDRQLQAINGLLAVLPERYRRQWNGGVKAREIRVSRLRMLLSDPSEAVESSRIARTLRDRFEILEWKPYGGTILQMLLNGIAHNFASDPEAEGWLQLIFQVEDALIASGELESDFVVAVCQPRAG